MDDLTRILARLRYLMLIAAAGAFLGALLLFCLGGARLLDAFGLFFHAGAGEGIKGVNVQVLEAVDAFLFGIVLMIFAFGIAFGLVFDLSDELRARIPRWMRLDSVAELKHTLVEVVLVVLAVDFARSVVEENENVTWQTLVLPASILLIAAALHLLAISHERKDE